MYSNKHIDNLFVNLKVLGKITTQGRKLYTDGDYLKLDDGENLKQKMYRTWYKETRLTTLEKIKEVVREAINLGQSAIYSEILLKSSNINNSNDVIDNDIKKWVMGNIIILKNLLVEMEQAIIGIRTLKDTYTKDSTLVSKLELEIQLLEYNINKFNKFINSEELIN